MNTIMNRIVKSCAVLVACLFLPANAMALNPEKIVEGVVHVATKTVPVVAHSKVAMQLLSEIDRAGGKSLSKRAEKLASDHGVDALHILAKDPKLLVPALERFSLEDQAKLLGVFRRKPAFMDAYKQYGDDLLKLELRSKGQSLAIARTFGDKGIAITENLTDKQLGLLAMETARFKGVNKKTIEAFLDMVGKYTGKTFGWLERHPKVMRTGTAAALVMNLKTELLGNPETGKLGAVQHITDSAFGMLGSFLMKFAPWGAGMLLFWLCFRSWLYRPRKQQTEGDQKKGWVSRTFRLFRSKKDENTLQEAKPL